MGFGPGFDGVLGGGDSWIARRKAAEAALKSSNNSREDSVSEPESKAVEIKEEEEEPDLHKLAEDNDVRNSSSLLEGANVQSATDEVPKDPNVQTLNNAMGNLSVGNNQFASDLSVGVSMLPGQVSLPPNQIQVDLASVEWSYLDPQGNVQGEPLYPQCDCEKQYPFCLPTRSICCRCNAKMV